MYSCLAWKLSRVMRKQLNTILRLFSTRTIIHGSFVLILWRKLLSKTSSYSSGGGWEWPLRDLGATVSTNGGSRSFTGGWRFSESSRDVTSLCLLPLFRFIALWLKSMFRVTTRLCVHACHKDLFTRCVCYSWPGPHLGNEPLQRAIHTNAI